MLKIGSRVFHNTVLANGYVADIDLNRRESHEVRFFWAKHCKTIHGKWKRGIGTKWQWSHPNNLVDMGHSDDFDIPNKVTSVGGRSLDRLIRLVCEIDRYQPGDGSDIILRYGNSKHGVSRRDGAYIINQFLVLDKYEQCRILGEGLAPQSTQAIPHDLHNWIVKPRMSFGGRGIHEFPEGYPRPHEYIQRKFPKVREFRAHCFMWMDSPVQFIQERLVEDLNQLCWNKKQGAKVWSLYQEGRNDDLKHREELPKNIREKIFGMSTEALIRLGYDFGGIDFGMDAEGNLKIFEVNSRMGLRETGLFTYKRAINHLKNINTNYLTFQFD